MKVRDIDMLTENSGRIKIRRGILWKWVMICKVDGIWKLGRGNIDIHDQVINFKKR